MIFPKTYKVLKNNIFSSGEYSIVPIRYEDRMDIMQWRNEQMYHLRQDKPLTVESQDNYFKKIVAELFDEEKPNQILFSYLKNDVCIGYGGLVHINWVDRNAEISFVLNSKLENEEFDKHWTIYLKLIEDLAFTELFLHKIYTYAFNLRPHLYKVLEENNYENEAVLKEHCFFNQEFIDVYIHKKTNAFSLNKLQDHHKELLFDWANDKDVRNNAVNSESISWENHLNWFASKLNSGKTKIFVFSFNNEPIGQIRIDNIKDDIWEIDYSIDKSQRGKGYGLLMTKALLRTHFNYKLSAIVRLENIASQKVFEKLEFTKNSTNESDFVKYYWG